MAVLNAAQRKAIRAAWGADLSSRKEAFPLTKPQLDAAVDATDDFIDTSGAAYNLALPVAARTLLTAAQKAELFLLVAQKRFGG